MPFDYGKLDNRFKKPTEMGAQYMGENMRNNRIYSIVFMTLFMPPLWAMHERDYNAGSSNIDTAIEIIAKAADITTSISETVQGMQERDALNTGTITTFIDLAQSPVKRYGLHGLEWLIHQSRQDGMMARGAQIILNGVKKYSADYKEGIEDLESVEDAGAMPISVIADIIHRPQNVLKKYEAVINGTFSIVGPNISRWAPVVTHVLHVLEEDLKAQQSDECKHKKAFSNALAYVRNGEALKSIQLKKAERERDALARRMRSIESLLDRYEADQHIQNELENLGYAPTEDEDQFFDASEGYDAEDKFFDALEEEEFFDAHENLNCPVRAYQSPLLSSGVKKLPGTIGLLHGISQAPVMPGIVHRARVNNVTDRGFGNLLAARTATGIVPRF